MAEYDGSIELISGITQKNGGTFPLVDASAVQVDESGTRLKGWIKTLNASALVLGEKGMWSRDTTQNPELVYNATPTVQFSPETAYIIKTTCENNDAEIWIRYEYSQEWHDTHPSSEGEVQVIKDTGAGLQDKAFTTKSLADGVINIVEVIAKGFTTEEILNTNIVPYNTTYSVAESGYTIAAGVNSHTEGRDTIAVGPFSHAEGSGTVAGVSVTSNKGNSAHAEGSDTSATGNFSHAEGQNTQAQGSSSHAEGQYTQAQGSHSHAEGNYTRAEGTNSHAEGNGSTALGDNSHAQGNHTITLSQDSFAFGKYNDPGGAASVSTWTRNVRYLVNDIVKSNNVCYICIREHTSGTNTGTFNEQEYNDTMTSLYTVWERLSIANFEYIETVGNGVSNNGRNNARTLDWDGNERLAGKLTVGFPPVDDMDVATKQYVDNAMSVNDAMAFKGTIGSSGATVSSLPATHKTGWAYKVATAGVYAGVTCEVGDLIICAVNGTSANDADWTVVQNNIEPDVYATKNNPVFTGTISLGRKSNTGTGTGSFAVGNNVTALGGYTHAEGVNTTADGTASHAEGYQTQATGDYSHAEGRSTTATGGYASHAEGNATEASGGWGSHAEGHGTIANHKAQHAFGEYNIADTSSAGANERGSFIEIVGNGTANNVRSNARTLDWDGNEVLAGKLTLGAAPTANMDAATKLYVDNAAISIIDNNAGSEVVYRTWNASKLIDQFALKADKTDTVLETTLSRGRNMTSSTGTGSFAFGNSVTASGDYSHAEGAYTRATGNKSHAEGQMTGATGEQSHAEGNQTTASGIQSHAEGGSTIASGLSSHAEGSGTTANHKSQHVFGEYNIADDSAAAATLRGTYIEIVGNGPDNISRSNARTLDWNGNEMIAGSLSRRRKANTAIGAGSIAFGVHTEASGIDSQAFGIMTQAREDGSFAVGIANQDQRTEIIWNETTPYSSGDIVCIHRGTGLPEQDGVSVLAGRDHYFRAKKNVTAGKWPLDADENPDNTDCWEEIPKLILTVGNGRISGEYEEMEPMLAGDSTRRNAFAVDRDGNGFFDGDVYVNADSKSINGTKLATESYVDTAVANDLTMVADFGTVSAGTYTNTEFITEGVTASYKAIAIELGNPSAVSTPVNIQTSDSTITLSAKFEQATTMKVVLIKCVRTVTAYETELAPEEEEIIPG